MNEGKPYRRVLIKLSGESLGGKGASGISADAARRIVGELAAAHECCPQIGVVVGAGNLLRGAELCKSGIDRLRCDHAGMIGTALNALVLQGLLQTQGIAAAVYCAFAIGEMVRPFAIDAVRRSLDAGEITIFAGGTGNPLFTTDSAAALRALQIGAQVLLKATNVDGVYSEDPRSNPSAARYEKVRFMEVLENKLRVMDWTAISLCMEHELPIRVFNFDRPGALRRVVSGDSEGTLVY